MLDKRFCTRWLLVQYKFRLGFDNYLHLDYVAFMYKPIPLIWMVNFRKSLKKLKKLMMKIYIYIAVAYVLVVM
jgi:hypothetical protein